MKTRLYVGLWMLLTIELVVGIKCHNCLFMKPGGNCITNQIPCRLYIGHACYTRTVYFGIWVPDKTKSPFLRRTCICSSDFYQINGKDFTFQLLTPDTSQTTSDSICGKRLLFCFMGCTPKCIEVYERPQDQNITQIVTCCSNRDFCNA